MNVGPKDVTFRPYIQFQSNCPRQKMMEMEVTHPYEPVGNGRAEPSGTELNQAVVWRNTSVNI